MKLHRKIIGQVVRFPGQKIREDFIERFSRLAHGLCSLRSEIGLPGRFLLSLFFKKHSLFSFLFVCSCIVCDTL